MQLLLLAGLALSFSAVSVAYITMPSNFLKSSKVLNMKHKHSSGTSSIIMRRFMMQDPENDPFVGFCKQVDDHRGVLVDVGAWSKELSL